MSDKAKKLDRVTIRKIEDAIRGGATKVIDFKSGYRIRVMPPEVPLWRRKPGEPQDVAKSLSPRESDVLRHFVEGASKEEIARRMSIAVVTVRNHTQNMLRKLRLHSKSQAVSYALRNGFVKLERKGDKMDKEVMPSPREMEVVQALAAGRSSPEIAKALSIQLVTVRNHIGNISRRLNLHSKIQIIAWAFRSGVVKQSR